MIEFKDLQIKYGDFIAIDNIHLTINDGEFFTFLGPSGCGKTTTLRTLVGFVTPSKGAVFVDGKDITHLAVEKRNIGIVFQNYALFPTMNVYENIAYGLKVLKRPKDEIHERVLAVSKKIDLDEEKLYNSVAELSGGQQQRVALARAIILEPKILCLDEPLSNLDAKLRVELRDELKRLQKNLGITTLYVTHDQEEALALSDRIAVFNKGYIEQVGTPHEIYNRSATEFVCDFIGNSNRLKAQALTEINKQTGKQFNTEKEGFIRTEVLNMKKDDSCDAVLRGKIIDQTLNGAFIKYTLLVEGQKLSCLEKNDGSYSSKQGSEISIYLDTQDILQY